jgi:hypothetical protein
MFVLFIGLGYGRKEGRGEMIEDRMEIREGIFFFDLIDLSFTA